MCARLHPIDVARAQFLTSLVSVFKETLKGIRYNAPAKPYPMTFRTNAQWLSDLHSAGPAREVALAEMRRIILTGLPYALAPWLTTDNPHYPALAEEVVQETLLRILAHLDTFEGRSQFTTWAHKIAVRVAMTELRRRHWKDASLENLLETEKGEATPRPLADSTPGPEAAVEQMDMLTFLQQVMQEELTPKQFQALTIVGLQGVLPEDAARQLGMERNALYKLLHDARVRLKRRLKREGLTSEEVLALFEHR